MRSSRVLCAGILCLVSLSCSVRVQSGQGGSGLSQAQLDAIRRYAEEFEFERIEGSIVSPPEKPNKEVAAAIRRAAEVGERRHLPYAALFLLRVFHEQERLYHQSHTLECLSGSTGSQFGDYSLGYEFVRLAGIERYEGGHWTGTCYSWVKENESAFSEYSPVVEELAGIEETRRVYLERSLNLRIGSKGTCDLEKIECFARLAPVDRSGREASSVPEEINALLKQFKADARTDHLPYLVEYGLNINLKHLKRSKLARILPVDENLMVAELLRLTEIPKYKTAHEAGWLNRQFMGALEKSRVSTGYSSYQVYLWYIEHWQDAMAMPNANRLIAIQKQIEETGMQGIGGGFVCHYGCS